MKRDCGKGDLIPIRWELVYSPPYSDKELVTKFKTLDEAMPSWNERSKILVACSNLRLYAVDKKGYANPVMSIFINVNGIVQTTDRRSEL